MRVEVRAFAPLRAFLPPGNLSAAVVDVPEGSAIGDVARTLGIADGTALVALLNEGEAQPTDSLREGDVLPPLAGG